MIEYNRIYGTVKNIWDCEYFTSLGIGDSSIYHETLADIMSILKDARDWLKELIG
jgi:hypothetical protein